MAEFTCAKIERKPLSLVIPDRVAMTWPYIAGFVDGEGTLTFDRIQRGTTVRAWYPQLIVFQKRPEVLYAIRNFMGVGLLRATTKNGALRLEVSGKRDLRPVLNDLAPHLIVKRRHAENHPGVLRLSR